MRETHVQVLERKTVTRVANCASVCFDWTANRERDLYMVMREEERI